MVYFLSFCTAAKSNKYVICTYCDALFAGAWLSLTLIIHKEFEFNL